MNSQTGGRGDRIVDAAVRSARESAIDDENRMRRGDQLVAPHDDLRPVRHDVGAEVAVELWDGNLERVLRVSADASFEYLYWHRAFQCEDIAAVLKLHLDGLAVMLEISQDVDSLLAFADVSAVREYERHQTDRDVVVQSVASM